MKDLSTERLNLRHFKMSDTTQMFNNWASDDEVTRYLSWPTHKTVENTKEVLRLWTERYSYPGFYTWAIEAKDSKEVIGSISLFRINETDMSAEVGYCIGRSYWNKGYATEACHEVINFSFKKLNLSTIFARHMIENTASARVMKKNNMNYIEGSEEYSSKYNKMIMLNYYKVRKEDFI
jgi:ribosomal-protein-alanine N-acetyltransferase